MRVSDIIQLIQAEEERLLFFGTVRRVQCGLAIFAVQVDLGLVQLHRDVRHLPYTLRAAR